jgi:PAP2 superfamily
MASAADWPMPWVGTVNLRGERRWLAVMAAATLIEVAWWALCWRADIAPAPQVATYIVLASAGLLVALALRAGFGPSAGRASWSVVLLGTMLIALGASFFLPLKYAIPRQVPFWLDEPLALGERQLFGTDPWRIVDHLFGWALVPVDRVYGLWLPVQSVVVFSVLLLPASARKSRALIAYTLAWFLLGVLAAVLCASVGPVFHDRLLGGQEFAGLADRLRAGAWMTQTEADAMWASFASKRPSLVSGMSAMPSLHVAISFWMWLAARSLAPRVAPVALAYAMLIWIGSVQLGWHYVSDGLAGAVGMGAIWWLVERLERDR